MTPLSRKLRAAKELRTSGVVGYDLPNVIVPGISIPAKLQQFPLEQVAATPPIQ